MLRILQDGKFERVGGERPLHVDVRIVAATHRDLRRWSPTDEFRQDLWYRLAVFPIRLPPLRDRPADIPAMAAHFALRAAKRLGLPPLVPTAEDIGLLVSYPWPGNVRELAAVIERAAILGGGNRLDMARALGSPFVRLPARLRRGDPSLRKARSCPSIRQWPATSSDARRTRGKVEGPGGRGLLAINPHTLRSGCVSSGSTGEAIDRDPPVDIMTLGAILSP